MLMDSNMLVKTQAIDFNDTRGQLSKDAVKACKAFFKGLTGVFGNYVATKNALVYRCLSIVDGYNQDVICIRLIQEGKVYYLGNSSKLDFVETSIAFGNRTNRWSGRQADIQRELQDNGIPMLPFQAFSQAGLKLVKTEILDQTGSEKVMRQTGVNKDNSPKFSEVHFTGASLFRNETKYFLFDIDREEIKHGIFNPFIVELPKAVSTVDEAYKSLKPLRVLLAEKKGIEVKRQGEWFFIRSEVQDFKPVTRSSGVIERAILQAGPNRPNHAEMFCKVQDDTLVKGLVTHTGREHRDLKLDGWYIAIPNTATRSFTITGDVD